MKKNAASILVMTNLFFLTAQGFCLAPLGPGQMKAATAQAGIHIAITDVNTEFYFTHVTFLNPDDTSQSQYIAFNGLHVLNHLQTDMTDADGNVTDNSITVDVGVKNNELMAIIDSPGFNFTTDMTVSYIDYCGTYIGSLSVEDTALSMFHLYLGPHAGGGVDFELGLRARAAQFSYAYNTTDSLDYSGITLADVFYETPENDPATWSPTGVFKIGNVDGGNPATMDFAPDTTAAWAFTDSDRAAYTVDNTRYNTGYIALSLPMNGSLRIDNITFGGDDTGAFVMDGINARTFTVEIPGRGLGKP
ncbi:MAG: hypothetical protein WC799_08405 [Desulfobacteraceae bacterium]|jgi:hypothetical protein